MALGWLWSSFGVALGSQWGAYRLAINTLWGGSDVALMWLWGGSGSTSRSPLLLFCILHSAFCLPPSVSLAPLSRRRSSANPLGTPYSRIWTKPCARPLRARGPPLRPPSARIADGRKWAIAHPPRPSPGRSPSLRPPRQQSHRSSAPRSDAAPPHSGRASIRLHRSPSPGTPGGAPRPTGRGRQGDSGGNAPSRAGWRIGSCRIPPTASHGGRSGTGTKRNVRPHRRARIRVRNARPTRLQISTIPVA